MWGDFRELTDSKSLESYLLNRQYEHSQYCHYTNLAAIDNILGENEFWLGNVKRFNDKKDSEQFIDSPELYYSICFSTGVTENLSLWYMYAGMDGHGGRVRLSKGAIKELINNAVFTLWERENNKKVKEIITLELGKTVELQFKDVLYYKSNLEKTNCDLKYNTMTNYRISNSEFNKYKGHNPGFVKGLIWYYEKETRLLLKVVGKAATMIDKSKEYLITMSIPAKTHKGMKIDFAPEITEEMIDCVVDQHCNIKKFMRKSSAVQLSKYQGTLKMNLCEKCNKCATCEKNKSEVN